MGGSVGSVVGAAVGGLPVVGGLWSDQQIQNGADSAVRSQRQANTLYDQLYGETQAEYAPTMQGGGSAFQALLRSYGLAEGQTAPDYSGFENSPDYLFAVQQGEKALARRQSAQGNRLSPGAFSELLQFNHGLSSQNLGSYRTGLGNIASMGQNATNALAQYRQGYAGMKGGGLTNIGDIRMAEAMGRTQNVFNWLDFGMNAAGTAAGMAGGGAGRGASAYGG